MPQVGRLFAGGQARDYKVGVWGIRTTRMIATAVLSLGFIAQAQAPDARPQFEVATIKPSPGGGRSSMGMGRSGDFEATNMPLRTLIAEAYHVKTFEVDGGPAWIRSDTFDIQAKPTVDPRVHLEAGLCQCPTHAANAARRPICPEGSSRDQGASRLRVGGCQGWPQTDAVRLREAGRR